MVPYLYRGHEYSVIKDSLVPILSDFPLCYHYSQAKHAVLVVPVDLHLCPDPRAINVHYLFRADYLH